MACQLDEPKSGICFEAILAYGRGDHHDGTLLSASSAACERVSCATDYIHAAPIACDVRLPAEIRRVDYLRRSVIGSNSPARREQKMPARAADTKICRAKAALIQAHAPTFIPRRNNLALRAQHQFPVGHVITTPERRADLPLIFPPALLIAAAGIDLGNTPASLITHRPTSQRRPTTPCTAFIGDTPLYPGRKHVFRMHVSVGVA